MNLNTMLMGNKSMLKYSELASSYTDAYWDEANDEVVVSELETKLLDRILQVARMGYTTLNITTNPEYSTFNTHSFSLNGHRFGTLMKETKQEQIVCRRSNAVLERIRKHGFTIRHDRYYDKTEKISIMWYKQ